MHVCMCMSVFVCVCMCMNVLMCMSVCMYVCECASSYVYINNSVHLGSVLQSGTCFLK